MFQFLRISKPFRDEVPAIDSNTVTTGKRANRKHPTSSFRVQVRVYQTASSAKRVEWMKPTLKTGNHRLRFLFNIAYSKY